MGGKPQQPVPAAPTRPILRDGWATHRSRSAPQPSATLCSMTFRRLLPLLILTTPLTLLAQRGGSGYRAPSAVALSPDGTTMAWTVGGREGTTLHLDSATAPDRRQRKNHRAQRHHQLLQHLARLGARLADPGLHLHLHQSCRQKGRKARRIRRQPGADLPLQQNHRRVAPAHPRHRPLQAGGLLARRQSARVPLRRKRHPLRRRTRRHEAFRRRHRRRRRGNPARLRRAAPPTARARQVDDAAKIFTYTSSQWSPVAT